MTELLAKGDRVSTYKGVLIRIKLIFFLLVLMVLLTGVFCRRLRLLSVFSVSRAEVGVEGEELLFALSSRGFIRRFFCLSSEKKQEKQRATGDGDLEAWVLAPWV